MRMIMELYKAVWNIWFLKNWERSCVHSNPKGGNRLVYKCVRKIAHGLQARKLFLLKVHCFSLECKPICTLAWTPGRHCKFHFGQTAMVMTLKETVITSAFREATDSARSACDKRQWFWLTPGIRLKFGRRDSESTQTMVQTLETLVL